MKRLRARLTCLLCVAACAVMFASPAWSNSRGGSDYGNSPLTTCGTDGPFNAVSATCYNGGGGFPDDFLFNFTLAIPLASTSVNSFTVNFNGNAPNSYGLVVGPCINTSGQLIVPCYMPNNSTPPTPPFTVTGTLGTGTETFNFTGFTGDLSGMVTVYFSNSSAVSAPTITNISTSTPPPSIPEPGTFVLLLGGLAVCFGLLKIFRERRSGAAGGPELI